MNCIYFIPSTTFEVKHVTIDKKSIFERNNHIWLKLNIITIIQLYYELSKTYNDNKTLKKWLDFYQPYFNRLPFKFS